MTSSTATHGSDPDATGAADTRTLEMVRWSAIESLRYERERAAWQDWIDLSRSVTPGSTAWATGCLTVLNRWDCRLPTTEGPPGVVAQLKDWAHSCLPCLPAGGRELLNVTHDEWTSIAEAFARLSELHAGPRRRLGSTAASKALHAFLPDVVTPWDARIATSLHGGRGPAEFRAHQSRTVALVAGWIDAAGAPGHVLPDALGRPGTSLPKLLDELDYLILTADANPFSVNSERIP